MSDAFWNALFTNLPSTLASLAALCASIGALWKIVHVQEDVARVERATNGMKQELVAVTRSDAFQQGRREGTLNERARERDLLRLPAPLPPGNE